MNPVIPSVQWCFQHNTCATQPVVFMKHFSPSFHLPLGCDIHLMQALPRPAPPTLTLSSRWLYRCTLRMWFRTGSFQSSTMLWVTTAGSSTRWREGRGGRGGRGDGEAVTTHIHPCRAQNAPGMQKCISSTRLCHHCPGVDSGLACCP